MVLRIPNKKVFDLLNLTYYFFFAPFLAFGFGGDVKHLSKIVDEIFNRLSELAAELKIQIVYSY